MSTLVKKLGSVIPDNLIAKPYPAAEAFGITLPKGIVASRGTVLALTSDGYAVLATANTGKANCIVAEDVDSTNAATTAIVYKTGHFNRKALICATGYTMTTDDEEALRNGGIFLTDMVD
jgi:hypothetical protein